MGLKEFGKCRANHADDLPTDRQKQGSATLLLLGFVVPWVGQRGLAGETCPHWDLGGVVTRPLTSDIRNHKTAFSLQKTPRPQIHNIRSANGNLTPKYTPTGITTGKPECHSHFLKQKAFLTQFFQSENTPNTFGIDPEQSGMYPSGIPSHYPIPLDHDNSTSSGHPQ